MPEPSFQLSFELARLVESGKDEEARALVHAKELSKADERKWLYHLGNLASVIWRELGTPHKFTQMNHL